MTTPSPNARGFSAGPQDAPPAVCRRASFAGKRQVRRALSAKGVAKAVGAIEPGCEINGLSKGQFSLLDLVEHALGYTGPADVVISTWTTAGSDIDFAFRLRKNGAIQSLRFLVDLSFPSRQPAYCAALRDTFGDDCIRVTKNHAKFVLLRNERWNVALRSGWACRARPYCIVGSKTNSRRPGLPPPRSRRGCASWSWSCIAWSGSATS